MRMSSGMSTPVSLAKTSTPSSPLSSSDELLELDQLDHALHCDTDLQSRLKLAESGKAEALLSLQKTQHKLEALEAKLEELVEANQAVMQRHDDLERQREEWATDKAKFAKRHLENKVAKKALEAKYSAAALELNDVSERDSKAQEEIIRLKDKISELSSSVSATVPDVEQDPWATECYPWSVQDHCLVLSVQGSLFRVSRRLLVQDSHYFEDLLKSNQALGDGPIGMTDARPIILEGVQVEEMNDFLAFLYQPPFQPDAGHLEIYQWATILKLATLWSFSATRAYAISVFDTTLMEEDSFDRLERAFACDVPKWVRPAYDAICRRWESLSADEGRRLGWERYAAICRIREYMARRTLDIPQGYYHYLADFSEHSPALQAPSRREHSWDRAFNDTDCCDGGLHSDREDRKSRSRPRSTVVRPFSRPFYASSIIQSCAASPVPAVVYSREPTPAPAVQHTLTPPLHRAPSLSTAPLFEAQAIIQEASEAAGRQERGENSEIGCGPKLHLTGQEIEVESAAIVPAHSDPWATLRDEATSQQSVRRTTETTMEAASPIERARSRTPSWTPSPAPYSRAPSPSLAPFSRAPSPGLILRARTPSPAPPAPSTTPPPEVIEDDLMWAGIGLKGKKGKKGKKGSNKMGWSAAGQQPILAASNLRGNVLEHAPAERLPPRAPSRSASPVPHEPSPSLIVQPSRHDSWW